MPRTKRSKTKIAFSRRLRTTIRGYIFRGVLVLVPLGVTAYVLALCYRLTAGHLAPFVQKYAVKIPEYAVEALSVLLFFALLYLLGLATAIVLGKRLISIGEAILKRIPLVKTIYAASKQVVELVTLHDAKPAYQAAVLVGFPNPNTKAFGFVTGTMRIEGEGEFYRVFVPTTPNPTSGYFEILPPELVQQTGLDIEEAVTSIMSAGILAPDPLPIISEGRIALPPSSHPGAAQIHASRETAALRANSGKRKQKKRAQGGVWTRTKSLLRKRILSGFLALVPLAVTVFVIRFVYDLTAGKIAPLTRMLVSRLPNDQELPSYAIAIASIVLLLVLLYVTGYVGTMMLGARLIRLVERIIERIPLATTVYGATKQIIETLFRHHESGPSFQTPVVVEFPYPGARTVGFELGTIHTSTGQEYVRVFVPTTPNVTVGLLELYEPHRVFKCGLPVEDVVKMVISGGMIGPPSLRLTPLATDEWRDAQTRP